ncbi:hydrolase 2, exosortase A system-associated [Roseateles toxinivorans]|uniref:Exosortase A-associated hydrolase 2 n=1 Tax=Roseateles toxinivorans TaxID=270368 RepID=A0A4R6QUW6_9BURK|nr:hydrolase 2, exosortase A system-associated [Roseateles toxinivorans]TDP74625.1 exosortase A-associated hydrolase 2 [Roseateles toxinivorans]
MQMTTFVPLEAFFLDMPVAAGLAVAGRFALFHPPQGRHHRGAVLYVHPLAEELNRSRRMAALQARALALDGWAVLQLDLYGCGDSAGDFGDATWDQWVADVLAGCEWLRQRMSLPSTSPLWLWGLRAGALLCVEASRRMPGPCHLLFWSPLASGKLALHQFLRLRAAAEMMGAGAKGVMARLRNELDQGRRVEVAGYTVAPALATGLELATLTPPNATTPPASLVWFELGTSAPEQALTPQPPGLAPWREAGFEVGFHLVDGPAFWQSPEFEAAPALIEQTTALVRRSAS